MSGRPEHCLATAPISRYIFHRAASMSVAFSWQQAGGPAGSQPVKLVMSINAKTAKDLGLAVPPSTLLLADKVIE